MAANGEIDGAIVDSPPRGTPALREPAGTRAAGRDEIHERDWISIAALGQRRQITEPPDQSSSEANRASPNPDAAPQAVRQISTINSLACNLWFSSSRSPRSTLRASIG